MVNAVRETCRIQAIFAMCDSSEHATTPHHQADRERSRVSVGLPGAFTWLTLSSLLEDSKEPVRPQGSGRRREFDQLMRAPALTAETDQQAGYPGRQCKELQLRRQEITASAVGQAAGDHAQRGVPGNSETGWPDIGVFFFRT